MDRTFPASERPFRPTPGNVTNPQPQVPGTPGSPIAGSVLPLQRAEELISIAHPDFRGELRAQAKDLWG